MTFSLADIFFVIVILVFALTATARGFVRELFGKAAWVCGIIGGVLFYSKLDVYLRESVKYEMLSKVISFLLVFVVIFLVVKIIQTAVSKFFEGEILRGLDRALGFFFGLVEGLAVTMLLILIMMVQPWLPVTEIFDGSFFYGLLSGILSAPERYIKESFA